MILTQDNVEGPNGALASTDIGVHDIYLNGKIHGDVVVDRYATKDAKVEKLTADDADINALIVKDAKFDSLAVDTNAMLDTATLEVKPKEINIGGAGGLVFPRKEVDVNITGTLTYNGNKLEDMTAAVDLENVTEIGKKDQKLKLKGNVDIGGDLDVGRDIKLWKDNIKLYTENPDDAGDPILETFNEAVDSECKECAKKIQE